MKQSGKLTQRQRLLNAFEDRGELYVYEIMTPQPGGLGISQYGARILELRRDGYPIINDKPGHFIYQTNNLQEGEVITVWEQQQKLNELRAKWKVETDPIKKKVIEVQGKLLKNALEMSEKDDTAKDVLERIF